MVSFMQSRLGPMEAGPHGSLQLLAEVGKSLQKEDIVPDRADRRLFKLAPYLVVGTVLLVYIAVPFGPDAYFANFDGGIFYALAVSSISTIGVLIAGWASANKYALMGGLRAAGQLIAYELPLILAVVGVVIQAGTLNLQAMVARPGRRRDLRLGRHRQPVLPHPVRRVRRVPHRQPGRAHPDPVRHADRRVRAGHRLHHRVHRPALPAVLHRRVRRRRLARRPRRHAVPRRLVPARASTSTPTT